MVELSIIIVNFNTKLLLKQCLESIYQNLDNIEHEIFVVDNNSKDGSPSMIKENFPSVLLIENKENVGFAKANNQAIQKARGQYLLLLNSDTIIPAGTLTLMVNFMDLNPKAGALGVKLVDRDSNLQTSCRHFPTVFTMLSQFFGLSSRFPKSKIFGWYDMGYWDHCQTRKVDCVPGTSLLVRKKAVQEVGLLDENYFMYFEDTDWCYRITRAGWKVVFLPEVKVIHLGGASADRSNRGLLYDKTLTRELFNSLFYYFRKFHGGFSVLILKIFIPLSLIIRMLKWIFAYIFRQIDVKEFSYKMSSFYQMIKYCLTSR
ncbi:MAG: glycosyltransferase family 2 protein [candidate division Zixibacteria bacterium]|nr:glycosyltransferase family 2 protein [candidate division Zixibacteria bacterium]